MKRIRRKGLAPIRIVSVVLAVACMSLAAASMASAAAPEIGRCLAVAGEKVGTKTVYHGGYTSKSCGKQSPTKSGKYEWTPGAGAAPSLETGSVSTVNLETSTGRKIECEKSISMGEITGAKTEKIAYSLGGCKDSATHKVCTTEVVEAEGEEKKPVEGVIRTSTLKGELGFINAAKRQIGWELSAPAGSMVTTFECGMTLLGTKFVVEGALISPIKGVNKMTEATHQTYKSVGGKQTPAAFEKGTTAALTAKIITGAEVTTESIGFNALDEVAFFEPLEYKTS